MRTLATLLNSSIDAGDWAALSAAVAVITGISIIIGVLISRIVVKPMIDAAVEKLLNAMVTREKFKDFAENDRREHDAMQKQMDKLELVIQHLTASRD